MLGADDLEYITSWKEGIQDLGESEMGFFDRFKILYPVNNRLYNIASKELLAQGKISKTGGDKIRATKNCILFLGPDNLMKVLADHHNVKDVESICLVIENHIFNIVLKESGEPDRDKDLELLKNLRSGDNNIRTLALLTIIYHVRCNLFHGDKVYSAARLYYLNR